MRAWLEFQVYTCALRFMLCSRLDEDVCSAQSIDEDVRSAQSIHEDDVSSEHR
jgi:hypothetical protein